MIEGIDIFSISTFVSAISLNFTLIFLLLFVRTHVISSYPHYVTIKRYMIASGLTNLVIDIPTLILLLHHKDIVVIDQFYAPLLFIVQMFVVSRSIHLLLHVKRFVVSLSIVVSTISFALLLGYIIGYFKMASSYPILSYLSVLQYTATPWATNFSTAINVVLLISFIICSYILINDSIIFVRKLNSFFSGTEVLNGKMLLAAPLTILLFYVFSGIYICFYQDMLGPIFVIINMIGYLLMCTFVFTLRWSYVALLPLDSFKLGDSDVYYPVMKDTTTNRETIKEVSVIPEDYVVQLIEAWENRSDKPFLRSGILLIDVANELKISPAQLSYCLNRVLSMNFNGWINNLRVEEAKKLFEMKSGVSISEVAYASGFSDLAVFSRVFKKFTGVSPKLFRDKK